MFSWIRVIKTFHVKKVLSKGQALDIFSSFFSNCGRQIYRIYEFPVVCHSKAALFTILHLVPAITRCNTLLFVGK